MILSELIQKKIGIFGFGVEGQSTLKYLQKQGAQDIVVFDEKEPSISLTCPYFSPSRHPEKVFECEVMIRSAGVHPHQKILQEFVAAHGVLTSQVELFFDFCPCPIVAITGTLGKGTCTSMIEAVLKQAQIQHAVGGNIGLAVFDLLDVLTPEHYAVLELSSFQTYCLKISPFIGVILQVTSEHLDWHSDLLDYRNAKANLVKFQKPTDICIFAGDHEGSLECVRENKGIQRSYGLSGDAQIQGNKIFLDDESYDLKDFKVSGVHQLENLSAALLVSQALGISPEVSRIALQNFAGLPMRLEKVGQKDSILYVNDSYATRPDATLGAIQSFPDRRMALILGGSEKNADFSELALKCQELNDIEQIALIGFTASRLKESLEKMHFKGTLIECATLEEAFELNDQYLMQKGGGVLLLSPACASFGLFNNYKERGYAFNRLVQAKLESEVS